MNLKEEVEKLIQAEEFIKRHINDSLSILRNFSKIYAPDDMEYFSIENDKIIICFYNPNFGDRDSVSYPLYLIDNPNSENIEKYNAELEKEKQEEIRKKEIQKAEQAIKQEIYERAQLTRLLEKYGNK